MTLTWPRIKRGILSIVGGLFLVVLVFYATGYYEKSSTISNLTTTARRNRPTADYTAASFAAQSCRRDYDERFFADIANAVIRPRDAVTPEIAQQITTTISADRDALAHIGDLCPTPRPPKFDPDGNLLEAPVIPPLQLIATTTTTTPGGTG
jgi:hypothetical protein